MTTTTMSKLDKKELKKPDEFVSVGAKAAQYVAENATMVIGGTLLVLVAIAALFGWLHQQREREVEAAGKLFEGEKLLTGNDPSARMFGMAFPGQVSDEDKKKAIEVFDRVAAEYPGTSTARRAKLQAGDVHLELGAYDEAVAAYEQALAGAGPEERFYARNGVAHALEGKQAWDDAAAAYRTIVDDESIAPRDLAALDLARVLVRAGKTDEARTILSGFPDRYPDSTLKDNASKELEKLGGAAAPAATPAEGAPSTPASGGTAPDGAAAPAPGE